MLIDRTTEPELGVGLRRGHWSTDGMVGHWAFNERGGVRVYDLANDSNGTLVNMGTQPWVAGEDGSALDFPGANGYVDLGDSAILDGATAFTILARCKFASLGADEAIVRKWDAGNQAFLFGLAGAPDELRIGANQQDQSESMVRDSTNANLITGVWYDLAGVWRGSNSVSLYRNGIDLTKSLDASTPSSVANVGERLAVGARYNGGSPDKFLDGRIQYVSIYNRDLSAAEVVGIAQNSNIIYEPIWQPDYVAAVVANDLLLLQHNNLRGNLQDLRGGLM